MHDYDPDSLLEALKHFPRNQSYHDQIWAGIMDDDCAISTSINGNIVATVDYLNYSPICVELGLGDMSTLGRLAVAASLSDLAGSGAKPLMVLSAVALPAETPKKEYYSILEGVASECCKWDVAWAGGDSKIAKSRSVLTVGIGTAVTADCLFLLHQSKPGDILWSSGELGSVAAATISISEPSSKFAHLRNWATDVLTIPSIPIHQSQRLCCIANRFGGTDVSDGLSFDVLRMCCASNVRAEINANIVPVSGNTVTIAHALGLSPYSFAFASGGDYQFVVSAPCEYNTAMEQLKFSRIGRIVEGSGAVLVGNDFRLELGDKFGHRDYKRVSFADEILQTCRTLSNAIL